MKRPAPTFPPPLALRPGETFVPLGSAQIPPGGTARLSTQPAVAPATATYTARPNDGTPDGDKLALLNDLLRAVPGAATTVLWFDERRPEVLHNDPRTPADDLVTLAGQTPTLGSALAPVVAAAMRKA